MNSSLLRLTACVVLGFVSAHGSLASGPKKNQPPPPQTHPVDLTQPLTLENAIKVALQNQNTLMIAKSQLDSARAREVQAKSSYYPQVAPTFNYSNQKSAFNVGGRSTTTTVEQSVTQIGARQLIFDTFKREEGVIASKYSAKASMFNVLDSRQAVIVNVSTSYYELLRRKELVKVAAASVARAKTTLDFTKAAAEVGTGPKKDILQAEADYNNAQVQNIIAENDVRIAATTLKNTMGVLSMLAIITSDTPLPAPDTAPDTKTAADYMTLAFDRRPDIKRETASVDTNRHEVKIANINAGLTVQADITEGYRIDPSPGENRTFNTAISYPLFDAGLTRAQVKQARASLDQSRSQLALTKQAIQLDVEQSYVLKEEARLRITATDLAVKAARLNYEAATASLKEGAGTIIDVITAQTLLVTAETNAVQAIFDFYTSDARLKRAIGDNDPYLAGGPKI